MRVQLGVKLPFIVIQVGVDVDEVEVFEPLLSGRFQLDQTAPAWAEASPKTKNLAVARFWWGGADLNR